MKKNRKTTVPHESGPVPQPLPSRPHDQLPHALTFYLTAGERKAVLRVLSKYKRSRGESLLRALGIDENN